MFIGFVVESSAVSAVKGILFFRADSKSPVKLLKIKSPH
jgi:hypothetical protein